VSGRRKFELSKPTSKLISSINKKFNLEYISYLEISNLLIKKLLVGTADDHVISMTNDF